MAEAGFQKVAELDELAPGDKKVVLIDDRAVAVFNIAGSYYAIDDMCTHDGGPLADGKLEGHIIECPRHGAKFDVCTGKVLCMPAVAPVRSHQVRLEPDGVYVKLSD
jgi:3-phenylpropionate/trans-cinnamate dioxygenase ferredoxin subunit